jgi:hypothetical protein
MLYILLLRIFQAFFKHFLMISQFPPTFLEHFSSILKASVIKNFSSIAQAFLKILSTISLHSHPALTHTRTANSPNSQASPSLLPQLEMTLLKSGLEFDLTSPKLKKKTHH